MSGLLMPLFRMVALDANGAVAPGAKLASYLAGTTTPAPLYTDLALTTPHENPVVADGNGVFPAMYGDRAVAYKLLLTDAADVPIWPAQDNVTLPPDVAPPVANSVPTGAFFEYGNAAAPTGYLACVVGGVVQQASQATYASLYAIIGTTYNTGGETAGYFRLPNKPGFIIKT